MKIGELEQREKGGRVRVKKESMKVELYVGEGGGEYLNWLVQN